jgi:hypothetical protein
MPQNRIPIKSYTYRPQGRSIGRSKKRWQEQPLTLEAERIKGPILDVYDDDGVNCSPSKAVLVKMHAHISSAHSSCARAISFQLYQAEPSSHLGRWLVCKGKEEEFRLNKLVLNPNFSQEVRNVLNVRCLNWGVGRGGPRLRPSQSPDLSPLYFLLCRFKVISFMKGQIITLTSSAREN